MTLKQRAAEKRGLRFALLRLSAESLQLGEFEIAEALTELCVALTGKIEEGHAGAKLVPFPAVQAGPKMTQEQRAAARGGLRRALLLLSADSLQLGEPEIAERSTELCAALTEKIEKEHHGAKVVPFPDGGREEKPR